MKLGHKALEARWEQKAAKWKVKIEDIRTGEVFEDQADGLITAIGALNQWRWPQIPGLQDFEGKLLHSAAWDQDYDYKVLLNIFLWNHVTHITIGKEGSCNWCWIKRNTDRTKLTIRSQASGSLCPWTNVDCRDLCPRRAG